jgi:hypothetical protein
MIIIIIIISEYLHGIEASVTDKINLQNMMQKLLPYLSCKNVRPVIINGIQIWIKVCLILLLF